MRTDRMKEYERGQDHEIYEAVMMRREAGHLKRWHQMPINGEDTVATHCWNATSMLLQFKPNASRELIIYMLEHDISERWIGDITAPAKSMFPELAKAVKIAEAILSDEMNLNNAAGLDPTDRCWAKAMDALDAWLFCQDQVNMGNRNASLPLGELGKWLKENKSVPPVVAGFVNGFRWQRYPDYLWEGERYGRDNAENV